MKGFPRCRLTKMTVLLIMAQCIAFAPPAEAATQTRTETFDTGLGNFTASNGNTSNGNNFGWSNTANASDPDTPGELGGVFSREGGQTNAYVADANLGGTLSQGEDLVMSGSINLQNIDWNAGLFVGFLNTSQDDRNFFMGLVIEEPSGRVTDPFRVVLRANNNDSTKLPIMVQGPVLPFDLTWNGSAAGDGSGTLEGMVNGQAMSVTVGPAATTFDAFGVGSGGVDSGGDFQTMAWFDDLTYSVVIPEPAGLTLVGISIGLILMRRRTSDRSHD